MHLLGGLVIDLHLLGGGGVIVLHLPGTAGGVVETSATYSLYIYIFILRIHTDYLKIYVHCLYVVIFFIKQYYSC